MIKVVEKTTGTKIAYKATNKSITFGDDDLMINVKNREADETVVLDICFDRNRNLVMGTAYGYRYVAQIEIPARKYTETVEDNPNYNPDDTQGENSQKAITKRTPVDFSMDNCTLYLYGID